MARHLGERRGGAAGGQIKMDITDIQFPDNEFDAIIRSRE
jgi:hypothetical protein